MKDYYGPVEGDESLRLRLLKQSSHKDKADDYRGQTATSLQHGILEAAGVQEG